MTEAASARNLAAVSAGNLVAAADLAAAALMSFD